MADLIKDGFKQIAELIKTRIDEYGKAAKELREKELKKSEALVCGTCGNSASECGCLLKSAPENSFVATLDNANKALGKKNKPVNKAALLGKSEGGLICKGCGGPLPKSLPRKKLCKACSSTAKSEDWIDLKHENDPAKRIKNIGGEGVVPGDKPVKKDTRNDDGSGGESKKLNKGEMGVPSAKPPKAPAMKVAAPITKGMDPAWSASSKPSGALKSPWETVPSIPKDSKSSAPKMGAKPPSMGKSEIPMAKAPPPIPGDAKPAKLPSMAGFKSLASNPTSGIHGGGHMEMPQTPKLKKSVSDIRRNAMSKSVK